MKQKKNKEMASKPSSKAISKAEALAVHLISGFGLAVAFWVAHNVHSITLTSHPSHTLCLIWVFECPAVILLYSRYRKDHEQCSYFKAVGRGLLGLPAGALINALGAIVLGAPAGIQYLPKTINWSLVMSLFTIVPAASVFGSSWTDWQRIFAFTKPIEPVDYMICLPAHGAIIGAWFGAFPMPLDWERPWQEWPICVSYGAIVGYLVGIVASLGFILVRQHVKGD
ncbi:PIGF/3-ketodihydrosphingosine reductase fusion protein [Pyrus communis]|uniref:PIGF/3-ketodihydrosphingosine reductase fusion protein n=1 Tax=Pyrus communis TaxID=23211 RepID=UPI0035BF9257